MTKSILSALAGLSIAGVAAAAPTGQFNLLDPSMYTLTATPLDGSGSARGELDPSFYSAMDGPYNAFDAATGNVGLDDYDSVAEGDILLTSFRFVGGIAEEGGGTMSFQFFNADEEFVDSFGITLTEAGNFIWTITMNSEVIIPADGFVQAVVGEDFTGQWFLGETAPTIGTNDDTFGGANGGLLSHRFELNGTLVPTPGAMALFGLAGIAGIRRRR
ncbi:MAG: hypothetical protein ACIAQF_03760 [Phycisphaerales bacterium JB065]